MFLSNIMHSFLIIIVTLIYIFNGSEAWSENKKVKLKEVETLTLYNGKMTTGRRSSPVPQLKCIGGSAGCYAFVPQVVQCSNRGSDGLDIQWECKTDMDNAYRFGHIQVTCEGYDYPDDPYILKGSCGLEYSLELTKEGMQNKNYQGSHGYQGNTYAQETKKSGFSDALFFFIVCLLIYAIYRSCLRRQQYSRTEDDFDQPDNRFGSGGMGFGGGYPNAPPPPGFAPGYTPDDSCSGSARRSTSAGSSGAGGFWTGAMAGSALGYMFGSRNNNSGYRHYSSPSSSNWSGGSGFSSGFSSGTRSASGYGGTSRR